MEEFKATISVDSDANQDLHVSDPAGGLVFTAKAGAVTSHEVTDRELYLRLMPVLVQIDDRDDVEIEVHED